MEDSPIQSVTPAFKRWAPHAVALFIAFGSFGYAVHQRNLAQNLANQNEALASQNEQVNNSLRATNSQIQDLTAKVNAMTARDSAGPVRPAQAGAKPSGAVVIHKHVQDGRLTKLQSQVDAQGKQIEDTRNDLASTRTELTGSIARTHDELVLLEKKGERNYYEFDIQKSKQFARQGPVGIRLKKANVNHQYADLEMMVEDRNLSQKHVNIYQPVMFYQADSQQPVEVVINDVTKDHIHGYVSAPKYRQSDLAAAAQPVADGTAVSGETVSSSAPPARRKLTVPE